MEAGQWLSLPERGVRTMYVSVTRDIKVLVEPNYLDDQSSPEDNYYAWAYRIRIENKGKEVVQLHSRYWQITDKHGRIQEVRGLGVVGEQPVLRPGEAFEYTSGAQLSTESGIMAGDLRDAGREWRDVPRQHPDLLAGQPARNPQSPIGACIKHLF